MNIRVEGKQKRAQATREGILEAYRALAANNHYDQISIAQIAEEAGVGKGSVLAHFSEKLALPATLFAQKLDLISEELEASSEPIDAQALNLILNTILDFTFTDDVYARLVVGEGLEVCRQVIEPSDTRLFAQVHERLITRLKDQPDMQIEAVRALFAHAVVLKRTCYTADEVKDLLARLINALL